MGTCINDQLEPLGMTIDELRSYERIEHMDEAGIDVQVLSLSVPNVYVEDIEMSRALAQISNDAISEICKQNPDRFLVIASVPWII